MSRRTFRFAAGFTLLELIAVLAILGVLAAIGVAKYADLNQQARSQAAMGAVASGQSALSMVYGRLAISTSTRPEASAVMSEAAANLAGADFQYSFSGPSGEGVITITATRGGVDATGTWEMP